MGEVGMREAYADSRQHNNVILLNTRYHQSIFIDFPHLSLSKNMNIGSMLKRKTPLKSYSHLTTRVAIKSSFRVSKPLRQSSFKSKHTPATPKAVLDSIFSQCIRRATADYRGYVSCATCDIIAHWRTMDCGHFQKREHMATRFDPRNCAPQCESCNCYNDGENEKFAEYIDRVHGAGMADELRARAKATVHDFPFKEKIAEWTLVLEKLTDKQDSDIQY